jgi:transcriptional regulator with XRE-family HTH domain
MAQDPWSFQVEALGRFIHAQRKMAKMSQRELAALSDISNAYLSQLERGLHQPSMRVINQVARALGMAPEAFLAEAGMLAPDDGPRAGRSEPRSSADEPADHVSAERAIREDPNLTDAQRDALLAVLRSFGGGSGT